MMPDKEFIIRLRPKPDHEKALLPVDVRLRQLLKVALRAFGFISEEVKENESKGE